MTTKQIDFEGLAAQLLSQARTLLPQWLPGGKFNGREYVCGDLNGGTGTSLSVNTETGLWSDFAKDDCEGGDLISLYAAINSLSQGEAAKALGGGSTPRPQPPAVNGMAAHLKHHKHGEPTGVWTYPDKSGEAIFWVARYENGKGKTFLPWIKRGDQYKSQSPRAPRPIYRLDKLAASPEAPVLIVEGEKAADAAQQLVGTRYIVTTWPHGSKAVSKVNWEHLAGRTKIHIWPDNDDTGIEAALEIAASVYADGVEVKIIDPKGQPEGWDAADAVAEGWDWSQFVKWAGDRTHPYQRGENTTVADDIAQFGAEALTDRGNALRLVRERGSDLRYVHQWGKWLIYNGKYWVTDMGDQITREFDHVLDDLKKEEALLGEMDSAKKRDVKKLLPPKYTKDLTEWIHKSQSRSRIQSGVLLARSRPEVEASLDDLDNLPWTLNCTNGTVDLRTGDLRPHQQTDMLTQMCDVEYDPDATCPRFIQFLHEIMPNEEMVDYLQSVLGYAISGSVREDCIWIFWGSGANGKSTLCNTIRDVLGKDYASTLAPNLLMESHSEKHATGLSDLYRRRIAFADETGEGRRLDESLVKRLTGRDTIKARRMREDFWEFEPTHKLFMSTNHKPEIRGVDKGMWRRLKLVPFTVTIAPANMDKDLDEKLREELPGILNWMVQGCLRWQDNGLTDPVEVRQAIAEYREESNPVERFVQECCTVGEDVYGKSITNADLYAKFCEWYDAEIGRKPMSGVAFGKRMSVIEGVDRVRTSKSRSFMHIALNEDQPAW